MDAPAARQFNRVSLPPVMQMGHRHGGSPVIGVADQALIRITGAVAGDGPSLLCGQQRRLIGHLLVRLITGIHINLILRHELIELAAVSLAISPVIERVVSCVQAIALGVARPSEWPLKWCRLQTCLWRAGEIPDQGQAASNPYRCSFDHYPPDKIHAGRQLGPRIRLPASCEQPLKPKPTQVQGTGGETNRRTKVKLYEAVCLPPYRRS